MESNTIAHTSTLIDKIKPFYSISAPYFYKNKIAILYLTILIVLTVTISSVYVFFSFVQKDIYNALSTKDKTAFYNGMLKYCCVLIVAVPIAVVRNYLSSKLSLNWRKYLTDVIIKKYYSSKIYYEIEQTPYGIDNPDERICEDINAFTTTSLTFFFIILEAIINLCMFAFVLLDIYPGLFYAVIFYSIFGTMMTMYIGRPLQSFYYEKLQKEADFRFGLIRTRENAECIAFYDINATLELKNIWNLFEYVYYIQLDIIHRQLRLEIFTKSYEYFAFVVPMYVVSPLYFKGQIELGSITQATNAFFNIRSDFSVLINYYQELSAFAAGIDRLHGFLILLETLELDSKRILKQEMNEHEYGYPPDAPSSNHLYHLKLPSSSSSSSHSVSNPIHHEPNNYDSPRSTLLSTTNNTSSTTTTTTTTNHHHSSSNSTTLSMNSRQRSSPGFIKFIWYFFTGNRGMITTTTTRHHGSSGSNAGSNTYVRLDSENGSSHILENDDNMYNDTSGNNDEFHLHASTALYQSLQSRPRIQYGSLTSSIAQSLYMMTTSSPSSSTSSTTTATTTPTTANNSNNNSIGNKQSVELDRENIVLYCHDISIYSPDGKKLIIGKGSPPYSASTTTITTTTTSPPHSTSITSINGNTNTTNSSSNSNGSTPISNSIGITMTIYKHDRILLVGPSGVGKSSILRAFAGLWRVGSGSIFTSWYQYETTMMMASYSSAVSPVHVSIHSPNNTNNTINRGNNDSTTHNRHYNSADNRVHTGYDSTQSTRSKYQQVFFLSQKPYNTVGNLRQQIKYPSICHYDDDVISSTSYTHTQENNEFLHILKQVKLFDLVCREGQGDPYAGLNVHRDWSKVLSLGEQQRLGFARILYHQPAVVFLDEATSAMDIETEEMMYNLLISLHITYISIGHRQSLVSFHNRLIRLAATGIVEDKAIISDIGNTENHHKNNNSGGDGRVSVRSSQVTV